MVRDIIKNIVLNPIKWVRSWLGTIVLTILTLRKPVERDRWLFGRNGFGMIMLSVVIAVVVPCVIWIGTSILDKCNPREKLGPEIVLLSNYDTDVKSLVGTISGDSITMKVSDSINSASAEKHDAWWAIVSQYTDPGNLPATQNSKYGYLLALLCAIAGIFCLSGFAVSSLVSFISRVTERWKLGLLQYDRMFSDYIVIIGINEQTASIARRALDSNDDRYVLIQTRQDVEKVRPELESKIDDDKQDRIVYYAGDRTSYEDIEKLHLEKAIEVYVLGESVENTNKRNSDDQLEKEHDAYNISCLEHISKYIGDYGDNLKSNKKNKKSYEKWKARPRLNVHVQFDYQSTFTAFKVTHLYQKLGRNIRFIPFNIHELWAKKVLVDNLAIYPAGNKTELKVQRYYPIDGKEGIGVNNKDKTVHLIVVGMNQMGTALATQAALLCHFPNFATDKSKKTVITFIDDNAIREAEYYMGRYSTLFELSEYKLLMPGGGDELFNPDEEQISIHKKDVSKSNKQPLEHLIEKSDNGCLLDVEWEFINGNAASKAVQKHILNIAEDKNKIVTIAICFNDSQQSLASAMYLPKTVYDHCNQVLVYQRSIFDVANDVARGDSDWHRYQHLFPFGMSEASYTENPFDSHLAALDYYMYEDEEKRKLVEGYFGPNKTKNDSNVNKQSFEDAFLKDVDDAWENAGIVRKTASIDSVDSIPFKLRSMGIEYCRDLDEIEKLVGKNAKDDIKNGIDEAEHNRWMMQRLVSGYRPFTKDEQKYFKDLRTLIKEVRNNIQVENNEFITKLNKLRDVFLNDINNVEEKKARKEELDRIIDDVVEIKGDENKVNDLLNSIGGVIKHRIDEKKEKERASYYICSSKRMDELEKEGNENDHMSSKDKTVIESIPILLRGQELLNVLILKSDDERYKHSQRKTILKKIFEGKFLRIEGSKKKEDYCKHTFRMANTAVSRGQWQFVTGKQVSGDAKLPVVSVSKNNVEDFLAILRKKSGLYFDLPSIKEWQTAADSDFADNNSNNWNCNHSSKDKKELMPVIEKKTEKKTEKKLHHFFGNVWEWTHKMDEHGKGLYKFVGGSFRFSEKECSPAVAPANNYWCHSWDADSKSDDLGFRLVWKYDRGILSVDANADADAKEEEGKAKTQRNEKSEAIEKWFKGETHKFVRVDSGYFVMGADKDSSDKPDDNEGPRHTVYISKPFYICKVPVTQSLWNAVMKEKKPRLNPTTNRIGDEFPQTDVCWSDEKNGDGVKEFMRKLNDSLKSKESFKKIIKSFISEEDAKKLDNGKLEFRLPTEAEWEYAAKGGNDKRLNPKHFRGFRYVYAKIWDYKGEIYYRKKKKNIITYNDYSSMFNNSAIDCAWFGQPSIHEVAQKEPNALGLYDMSGNVWEWCYDYYIAEMYDLCRGSADKPNNKIQNKYIPGEYQEKGYITDPVALAEEYSAHVFRGGSWRSSEWDCRCTRANYWGENYKANDLGFRLVLGTPIDQLGQAAKDNSKIENANTSNKQ